jgi:glycosidase
MYYGEEIGMSDVRMPYKTALDPIPHLYKELPRFLVDFAGETLNRDEVRTPMQWSGKKNAGFSFAEKTWQPVHTNFSEVNVEKESSDNNSLLNVVQRVLKIRNEMECLRSGTLAFINRRKLPAHVLAYQRKLGSEEVVVFMNFGKQKNQFSFSGNWKHVFAINADDKFSNGKIELGAYGAIVLKK